MEVFISLFLKVLRDFFRVDPRACERHLRGTRKGTDRPSGVPSCTRLCNALSAALSAVSSGSELMKSGCDSSEARCSSNEGGCGRVAMILSLYVEEIKSENELLSSSVTDCRWQGA